MKIAAKCSLGEFSSTERIFAHDFIIFFRHIFKAVWSLSCLAGKMGDKNIGIPSRPEMREAVTKCKVETWLFRNNLSHPPLEAV